MYFAKPGVALAMVGTPDFFSNLLEAHLILSQIQNVVHKLQAVIYKGGGDFKNLLVLVRKTPQHYYFYRASPEHFIARKVQKQARSFRHRLFGEKRNAADADIGDFQIDGFFHACDRDPLAYLDARKKSLFYLPHNF